jgi:hypothetical protein
MLAERAHRPLAVGIGDAEGGGLLVRHVGSLHSTASPGNGTVSIRRA